MRTVTKFIVLVVILITLGYVRKAWGMETAMYGGILFLIGLNIGVSND